MKSVAVADVHFMRQILTDYKIGYIVSYDKVVERLMMLMDDVFSKLPKFSNASIPDFNLPVTVSVRLLDASLESLMSVDSAGKNAPNRLHSDNQHWAECQNLFREIKASLTQILQYQVSTWLNETANLSEFVLGGTDDPYRHLTLYKCAGAFAEDLNLLVNTFNELDRDIMDLINAVGFYDVDYLEAIKTYIGNIHDTKIWFLDQLSLYSKNRTTQLKLETRITESKLSNVSHTLENIMSIVNAKALKRLQLATYGIIDDLKGWYRSSLSAMKVLSPYYDDNVIEDKVRVLKIWRHPLARMATSDILQFKYTTSESWHSWEASVSLQDFVHSGNSTAVVWTIMDDYSRVLRNELLQFEMECNTAKDDIIQAFREVMDHFSHIYSESLIDEYFVRWVHVYLQRYHYHVESSDMSHKNMDACTNSKHTLTALAIHVLICHLECWFNFNIPL